jgi:hypothetical protein
VENIREVSVVVSGCIERSRKAKDSVRSAQPDNRLPGNFFHFFPVHFLADLTQAGPIHKDDSANCIRLSSVTKKPGIVLYLSDRLKMFYCL